PADRRQDGIRKAVKTAEIRKARPRIEVSASLGADLPGLEHLGADFAEELDPREIGGLGEGDFACALQGEELIGGLGGVLANPAGSDAAGLQEKFTFVGHSATQRKGLLDHDRLA